jgi:hypothetical protein
MVVPPAHVALLRQPLSFWLATASLDNKPEPFKCTGVRFHETTDTFTCFAPRKFAIPALKYVVGNPIIALLAVELNTYEGYQYKGPYLSHRDCTEDEVAHQYRYLEELTTILESFGYSGTGYNKAYKHPPFVAIVFRAEQVFDQYPRQGTGGEITKGK